MHAIVNTMKLVRPLEDELLRRMQNEVFAQLREANAGFLGGKIVRVSELEVVMLAFWANREVLDELSNKIAGPWFAANVRPYLAGPVTRVVGEIIVDVSY